MSLIESLTATPERRVAMIMGGLLVTGLIVFATTRVLYRVQSRSAALQEISERIRNRVESIPRGNPQPRTDPLKQASLISRFYEARGFQPLWTDGRALLERTGRLIEFIRRVRREGLEPADYHLEPLHTRIDSLRKRRRNGGVPGAEPLTELELLLTDALFQLAVHRAFGRIDPRTYEPVRLSSEQQQSLLGNIKGALEDNNLFSVLETLPPSAPSYRNLVDALEKYRGFRESGGWPSLPRDLLLKKGDRGRRVELLRQRLTGEGWLEETAKSTPVHFDTGVEEAVRRFQRQHGLAADGIVGGQTVAALNVSAKERVRQITVNLERWRWLNLNSGAHYILVNLGNNQLQVLEKNHPVLSMKVIVGRAYRGTPVFSDRLSHLVFNPSWNVPEPLLVEEFLPRIKEDPQYLTRNNYRVLKGWGPGMEEVEPLSVDWNQLGGDGAFPYRIRQDPGPSNRLGQFKFMFPNPHRVYFHDTPEGEATRANQRHFSLGCMRVEKPFELAMHLLRANKAWTRERVQSVIDGGSERTVMLTQDVPIHITYWTSWVDQTGLLQFRPDIYDRDRRLEEALRTH